MQKLSVGRIVAVAALVVLTSAPVFAQTSSDSTTMPLGVMFNVGGTVWKNVQVVGDFGVNRKDGVNVGTATGGVRYLIPVASAGKVTPFVEGLAGIGFLNGGDMGTETAFAWGFGGGTDVTAIGGAGLRLQVNYFQMAKYGVTFHEVRFGVGVSFGNKLFKAAAGWAPSWLKATGVGPV